MKYLLLTGSLALALHTAQCRADAAPGQATSFSGKVLQTTNAASYTYVQVDTGKQQLWVAAPQFPVKPGDTVTVAGGMPMPNYHSKTLNRDFDVVYFTGSILVNGANPSTAPALPELPKNHPPVHGGISSAAAHLDFSHLKKAPGGQTVQEIVAAAAKLKGREVNVRGKVVKYNAQILGKNWLHLRDGTGSAGSNDLLITTTNTARVGDTVLVTGKVATNQDFGMNYKYPVMLEDAKVVVESNSTTLP